MRITKTHTILLSLGLLGAAFLLGRSCAPTTGEATSEPAASEAGERAAPTVWTCSMHPQVQLPKPGKCPICFMDLIPLAGPEGDDGAEPRTLTMSAASAALAEIETAPVERRLVAHEVRMVGKVAYDETRMAYITAWVPGRLDRLFVDYTGVTVRAGDHLVEIYSPELYTAQQELLQVIRTADRLERSSSSVLRRSSEDTVGSAREKLRLLGMSVVQIEDVVERGRPSEHVTILAPIGGIVVHKNALEGMYVDKGTRIYTIADLSKVWVLLDAYESDIAWLRYGQDVELRVEAYRGETFHGRIAFIDPVLDDRTRTVKVRLIVDNAERRLKPGMLVSAVAAARLTPHGRVVDPAIAGRWMCPMHPEVLGDGPDACPECGMDLVPAADLGFVAGAEDREPPLVIPATAPLLTGKRAVVYVALPDRDKPTFEGRVIELGPRAGDWYVVNEGLAEGERIVVRGGFKIDSELQIRARPSMMSPDDAEPAGPGAESRPARPERLPTPRAFRAELGAFLDAYLALHAALASDEEASSARAAEALVDAFAEIGADALDEAAQAQWRESSQPLWKAVRAVAAAASVGARRLELDALTRSTEDVLRRFGFVRDGPDPAVFHCPMAPNADGGTGADWIQVGPTTTNPYYGASMLRCGEQARELAGEER